MQPSNTEQIEISFQAQGIPRHQHRGNKTNQDSHLRTFAPSPLALVQVKHPFRKFSFHSSSRLLQQSVSYHPSIKAQLIKAAQNGTITAVKQTLSTISSCDKFSNSKNFASIFYKVKTFDKLNLIQSLCGFSLKSCTKEKICFSF